MRLIHTIVIHCAATKGDVSAATIRKWHKDKGWRDIGYHLLIRTSGAVEIGRPIEQAGAHVRGHNKDSIGICIAGGRDGTTDSYTPEQWHMLEIVVQGLVTKYGAVVKGHNDYTNAKTCPNFDAKEWFENL